MSTISTTGAKARTDVTTGVPDITGASDFTRKAGLALAAGTASWAAASYVYGFTPDTEAGVKITDLTALLFQGGVMALLHVQLRTRATGVKAISRRLLKVERVLLALAMLWSVLHAFLPSQREAGWLVALDVFWPLSMLGMFFIGIKVAIAGRWRGPVRLWSFLAESWAPMSLPVMAIFGHGFGDMFAATHLLLGYTALGLFLFTRPELVQERD